MAIGSRIGSGVCLALFLAGTVGTARAESPLDGACGGPDRAGGAVAATAPALAAELPAIARADCRSAATRDRSAPLGATVDAARGTVTFRVYSKSATHLQVDAFDRTQGGDAKASLPMARDPATDVWSATLSLADLAAKGIGQPVMYGYRAWGPNWTYDPTWKPGSHAGFVADVDAKGNRFNPNKLLLDPYAPEVTHDALNPESRDRAIFTSGPATRDLDDARVAPKGIALTVAAGATGAAPTTAQKDDVVYEVHVRGLTQSDSSLPAALRGTYAGAARKAEYLKSLGVTAVEFLPIQETQNDENDVDPTRANYWGYMTTAFFAPDRRFASDKSAGGPTREFQQMVKAFHDAGIKVWLDVVYNHTGEGGILDGDPRKANLLSFRGLDDATWYLKAKDARFDYDLTGTGNTINAANPVVRDFVLDSLEHWHRNLGVDGFRFDLAAVLGNESERDGFSYRRDDPCSALSRAPRELGVRPPDGGPGVDLIAEPWDAVGHNLQGQYPEGWSEWNGRFRDEIRAAQNQHGVAATTPGTIATRVAGSADLFEGSGRRPYHSVNFLTVHDGFTLADLYRHDGKNNAQAWPYGPSDGGADDNRSWNQGGDPERQARAARTGMALLMLSSGVPLVNGGDEFLRTLHGNNNPYNLDTPGNWLDWSALSAAPGRAFFDLTRSLIAFRKAHPAIHPADFYDGADHDGNGLKDVTWLDRRGLEVDHRHMSDAKQDFLGWRIDGAETEGEPAASIYVAYDRGPEDGSFELPPNLPGMRWWKTLDTARDGAVVDAAAASPAEGAQAIAGRSLTLYVERAATTP